LPNSFWKFAGNAQERVQIKITGGEYFIGELVS